MLYMKKNRKSICNLHVYKRSEEEVNQHKYINTMSENE